MEATMDKMYLSLVYDFSDLQFERFKQFVYKEFEKQEFCDREAPKAYIDVLFSISEKARKKNTNTNNIISN